MDDPLDAAMAGLARICSRCGYDLRGVQSSVCPECGKPIALKPNASPPTPAAPSGAGDIGGSPAPPTAATIPRTTAKTADPPLPVMVWLLLGLAAMCLLVLMTAILQESTDDPGWMLGFTLAPAGLAAALYVARK